jgi:acyl-CoA synthetase (AMP-forming)/AMP-acid ligase II
MPESVVHALTLAARNAPGRPAISSRETLWTYGDLSVAVEAVRRELTARALPQGSRIAILLGNCAQYVALYYGIMAAGHAAVPLNWHERHDVLVHQIGHCSAAVLFGDPGHAEWGTIASGASHCRTELIEVSGANASAFLTRPGPQGSPAPLDVERVQGISSNQLAAIFFTSGTTGNPKAVMLSHRNLISNARAIASYLELTSADSGLCVLPMHFSYGNSVLNTHIISGARLVMEDSMTFPHLLMQRLQDEKVTGFSGVPASFALLRARCSLENYDLSHLRYVTQAGGAMPRVLVSWIREQLPRARLFLMYGQTEATARITRLPPERLDDKAGSVGIPVAGTEILVTNDAGASLPPLQDGEICVRGPGVMLGYWNNAAATSETIRDGWLRTGDLGHLDGEGFLYITGRAVEMIKTGAYRVSPREVEEVIVSLQGVEDVAVVEIADDLLGHSIKAVVVLKQGHSLDTLAVKAHCRARLASYKVPKIVEFASSLPRTASGKLLRSKLA